MLASEGLVCLASDRKLILKHLTVFTSLALYKKVQRAAN